MLCQLLSRLFRWTRHRDLDDLALLLGPQFKWRALDGGNGGGNVLTVVARDGERLRPLRENLRERRQR